MPKFILNFTAKAQRTQRELFFSFSFDPPKKNWWTGRKANEKQSA
jgi:hypothetical protein